MSGNITMDTKATQTFEMGLAVRSSFRMMLARQGLEFTETKGMLDSVFRVEGTLTQLKALVELVKDMRTETQELTVRNRLTETVLREIAENTELNVQRVKRGCLRTRITVRGDEEVIEGMETFIKKHAKTLYSMRKRSA